MLTVGDRALVLGTNCVVEVQKITRRDCIVKAGEGRTFSISRAELAQLPYLTNDFWWAAKLLPYYDPISEHGLAMADGDDLYRLSSAIPLAERRRIPLYPRGSFHTYATEGVIIDGEPWDSLEDWRVEWEKQFVCAKEGKPHADQS